MAQSKNNPLTKGASGMIGKTVVFRSWNGKTYMYNRPSKPKMQSPLQKENRTKFSRAVAFSRRMMLDPLKKAEYQKIAKEQNLPNAYTAAVTEYMRKPEIQEIETQTSEKEVKEIRVVAKKKGFELLEVEVIIVDDKGNILEEGKTTRGLADEWVYTANGIIEKHAYQVVVRARDRTNNMVERKILI
jgi:hypothetical protein